jgi:hypothetical protein
MFKVKRNEILRVAAVALVCIGLFSAAFIGINTIALAAATSQTETLPPAAAINAPVVNTPIVPVEDTPAYQAPALTVDVPPNGWFTPSADALSPEEAADLGARYIWDVTGESIDGKFVSMFYSHAPSSTRAYWHGQVGDSAGATEVNDVSYSFTICAVSGERIGIDIWDVLINGMEEGREIRELVLQGLESIIDDAQLAISAQSAREYAQRHFNNTVVVSVEFQKATPNAVGRDASENAYFTDYLLIFTVTDNTGREADVRIFMESGQLFHISTQHNDVIPGYRYEGGSGIG